MSAKNRPDLTGQKKPVVPFDRYYTPRWLVEQVMREILPMLMLPDDAKVLDAGCGRHAIWSLVLHEVMPKARIVGIDNDETIPMPYGPGWTYIQDNFLGWVPAKYAVGPFDLVMGNPPYTYALPFMQHALRLSPRVMFLVRQGFMSSKERAAFFRDNSPNGVWIFAHRPAFTNPVYETKPTDTDQTDYCMILWDRKSLISAPPTLLRWMPEVPLGERR